MKLWRAIALLTGLFFFVSCGTRKPVLILADGAIRYAAQHAGATPRALFAQAGIALRPQDRVLLNGVPFPLDGALPQADSLQLQLRRAVKIRFVAPSNQTELESAALTLGEALAEAGLRLTVHDFLDPPAETPLAHDVTATYIPARELNVSIGGQTLKIFSAQPTVGEALAEAGIPLLGADYSIPPEGEPPPPDGVIRVVRVAETFRLSFEPVPYPTQWIDDPNLPMGEEQIVQPGIQGLALLRERIRYEDGAEALREAEAKMTLRAPQEKIARRGSKIVLADINGLDYWLATQMYATVYSPCASGTGSCSYGTASGARAGYGIVAVDSSVYPYLAGMRVYIPGYGAATIGDVGGGSIIESKLGIPRSKWIDLGFDDGKIVNMTGWVTVYFLAPAPAEIPPFLK